MSQLRFDCPEKKASMLTDISCRLLDLNFSWTCKLKIVPFDWNRSSFRLEPVHNWKRYITLFFVLNFTIRMIFTFIQFGESFVKYKAGTVTQAVLLEHGLAIIRVATMYSAQCTFYFYSEEALD